MKTVIILILLVSAHLTAQEIRFYDFDIRINPDEKSISVEGFMETDFQVNDTINLLLWKNSSIKSISCNEVNLQYHFDTLTASSIMYIPDGRKLTIIKSPGSSNNQTLKISYSSNMSQLKSWAGAFNKEWIELNFYSAWFPVCLTGGNFTSKFKIYIDDEFDICGSGAVSKKEEYWEMVQPWGSFDNVIIASNELKSKAFNSGEKFIQIDYNENEFSRPDAESSLNECKNVLNYFQNCYGKKDSVYVNLVIAPFEAGGYSRKNFVRMGSKQFDLNTTKGIAHEIAHFWWTGAETTTWEDWLNEAFAEYCMLLYVREKYGGSEFLKMIEEYKSRTKYSSNGLPPVWGIDRSSSEAYSVIYEKGALILYEFEEYTGREQFSSFLKKLCSNKIKTTVDVLSFVEKEVSGETRNWLENKLKNN